MTEGFDQFVTDIVADLPADVLTPALRHCDTAAWILDTLQHRVNISGIEIVSGANGAYRFYGLDLKSLGFIGKPENTSIAEKLKTVFASWIDNGHTDLNDENTIILCVKLTDAVLFSHGTRYEF